MTPAVAAGSAARTAARPAVARLRAAAWVVLLAAGGAALSGCAPLVVGAAVGGAAVATDRRSVGIQLEDEAIERRVNRALRERFKNEDVNINVTSYNRKVLLTGEAPTDQAKAEVEQLAAASDNVRSVLNELRVGPMASAASRTNDIAMTGKVRARLLESRQVPMGAVKIVTERNYVYLLGRVTEAEGDLYARLVSQVSNVNGVIKAFDYLTEKELAELRGTSATPESQRK
jgi:osmotically-inducible protein OsmY